MCSKIMCKFIPYNTNDNKNKKNMKIRLVIKLNGFIAEIQLTTIFDQAEQRALKVRWL